MAEIVPPSHKLIWIAAGGAALMLLCYEIDAPLGMYLYTAVGALVAGFWFWDDKAPDKEERWDIAIALPILALIWPVLAPVLIFRKHFRDP